jgi:uncharacterized protein YjeT (DUF2065 family)
VETRLDALLSLIGLRAGAAGLALTLAPRWFRHVVEGFLKLSDNELRIIGYVLIGTSASVLAQRANTRALTAKLDALGTRQPALAPGA